MTKIVSLRFAILAIIVCSLAANAHAGSGLTVIQVKVDGNPPIPGNPPNIELTYKDSKGPEKTPVKVGMLIPSGTTIETIEKTTVKLTSENGNIVEIEENTKVRLAANSDGESYTGFFGEILFAVANKLNFFTSKDSSNEFKASVDGTNFSMKITGKAITFAQTSGKVLINKAVRLKIGNVETGSADYRKPELTRTETHKLSGNKREKTYKLDSYEDDIQQFPVFEVALETILKQYRRGQKRGDSALVADSLTTLGYLFLDNGQPEAAISQFNKALKLAKKNDPKMVNPTLFRDWIGLGWAYLGQEKPKMALEPFRSALDVMRNIDPADPLNAEAGLALAEAQFKVGQEKKAKNNVRWTKEFLGNDIAKNLQSLQENINSHDESMAWLVARQIVDDYHDLAWAAKLEGKTERANMHRRNASMVKLCFEKGFLRTADPRCPQLVMELNTSIRGQI